MAQKFEKLSLIKKVTLSWWKYVSLPMFLASTRRMISRLQLPHFLFHGHTKVFFFQFYYSAICFRYCAVSQIDEFWKMYRPVVVVKLHFLYYESVIGNFLFVPFEKNWGLTKNNMTRCYDELVGVKIKYISSFLSVVLA